MNIKDIKELEVFPDNIWKEIFEKQMSVAVKYKDIEKMGNLLETTDTNIDTRTGQKWIKDFAWRVTEEIAEALEAKEAMSTDKNNHKEHYTHYLEEMIDALHFLTELAIIAGYDWKIVPSLPEDPLCSVIEDGEWNIVYHLGLMCNCLKNKPWKQTEMLTDRPKFKDYLINAFYMMYRVLKSNELSDEDIYNLYFKKNEVNKFRIRSKY